jgi:hypothetical protein
VKVSHAVACQGAVIVISWVLFSGLFCAAHSQQTISNVPTTDVLDRGKLHAELDVTVKPTDAEAVNRFTSSSRVL